MEDNGVAAGAAPIDPVPALHPASKEAILALNECIEWMEEVTTVEPDEEPCDWPNGDGATWCCEVCKTHGCAKSRTHFARRAITALKLGKS